jgi:hypothetical protein
VKGEYFMKYILSFDIAKGKSVYCFINSNKDIIIEPTSINHLKNEFDDLFIKVKDYDNYNSHHGINFNISFFQ